MSKSSNWESTIKPIVVLSVISLIASLLLALVNGMTAPVIAENTKRTTLAAYVGVLPSVSDASELEEVTDYTTPVMPAWSRLRTAALQSRPRKRALTAVS